MRTQTVPAASVRRRSLLPSPGLILGPLLLLAAVIRLYRINEPPLGFHATRQYRSLIIARGFYYDGLASVPEWKRHVAGINVQRQGILEPPVGEFLTAIGYRVTGGESYWLPAALSIVFWLIGALFLYRIAARLLDTRAGLAAAAVYLFLPFGIVASRSFQPDPLMVMLALGSVLAMLRYHDDPSHRRLVVAAGLSAVTIFVKPVAVFVLYAVFFVLLIRRHRSVRLVADPSLWIYVVMTLIPALGYYVIYGLVLSGNLETQAQASFIPLFVLDPAFWRGWIGNIGAVVGFPLLVTALLGAFLFQRGTPRALIFGLWGGYAAFCLVFSYHIATHDYYHLQLVPIVALSVAPIAIAVLDRVLEANREVLERAAIVAIVLVGSMLTLIGVRSLLAQPSAAESVRTAEEIGSLVDHNTRNVVLASDYGASLQYHGELSSRPWPLLADLEWERLAGVAVPAADVRFEEWFGRERTDYFIVTDLRELAQQDDLEGFLESSFPILARTDEFVIFDLRGPSG